MDAGLIFQLSTLNDEIFARDVEGQQINWLEATPRGFARRNAFGALDVSAGGYMIEQVGSLLADYLERTQAFTLMASVTCFDGDIAGEARIISLSVGERGMKLVQRGAQIMFRTEGMDGNRVCEALPGERRHIGITYADRTLHYVVNGLSIAAETLDEKISIPNAATLSFGEVAQSMSSRWNGIISLNVMYAGKIRESGTAEEVYLRPSHPYTVGLLNSVPRLDRPASERLDPIEGEIPDPASLPAGCAFHPRCRWSTSKCGLEDPVLERIQDRQMVACFESESVARATGLALY